MGKREKHGAPFVPRRVDGAPIIDVMSFPGQRAPRHAGGSTGLRGRRCHSRPLLPTSLLVSGTEDVTPRVQFIELAAWSQALSRAAKSVRLAG